MKYAFYLISIYESFNTKNIVKNIINKLIYKMLILIFL